MVLSPRSGFEDTCSVARPRWHEINNNEMHQVELVQQRNVIIRLHDAKRMEIRRAAESDFEAMWPIFRDVVASGDTYVFSPDTSRDDAFAFWFGPGVASYVAEAEGRIVGMYKIVQNHRDLGSHIANASFMVAPCYRGRGAGRRMGLHALREARQAGFLGMQFNFVLRCSALKYDPVFSVVASCPRGASPVSVRRQTFTTGCWGCSPHLKRTKERDPCELTSCPALSFLTTSCRITPASTASFRSCRDWIR